MRLNGSRTHKRCAIALPWLGRRPCNSVPLLVGGPSLLALFGGSRTYTCSEGEGGIQMWSIYLLSSGLGAAVTLFTDCCKGTTVPYFL